jgi:hypothetical protein
MMPLLPVALGGVLAALVAALARQGFAEPASPGVALAASLALAPLGFLIAAAVARQGAGPVIRSDSPDAARVYTRQRAGAWLLLLALYAFVLDRLGLVALADDLGPLASGPVLLGPWVLACFGVWSGQDEGERAVILREGLTPGPRFRALRGRARRVLVPLAALLALDFTLELLGDVEPIREALDLHPRARTFLVAGSVFALFALAPLVLRLLFATRRFDLPGAPGPVRLWDVGIPVATASVAGLFASYRVIFVTPSLLETMDRRETEAVMAHEGGHGALGHLRVFALLATAVVVGLDDLAALDLWAFAVLAALVPLFVALSRRLEHDADLYAAAGSAEGAEAVSTALLKTCAVNGQSPESGGIRHPSVGKRIALVRRAAEDPSFGARRLRRSRRLLAALSVAALVVIARGVLRAVEEARSPLGDRLVLAASERLDAQEPALARDYARRAGAAGVSDGARPLLSKVERALEGR